MGFVEICEPAFLFLNRLKTENEFTGSEPLEDEIFFLFDNIDKDAEKEGIPSEQVSEAKYAITVLLDEIILDSSWQHKDEWRKKPLEHKLYKTEIAGAEFFDKLEEIRTSQELVKSGLLEIFFLTLAFGFEGKYKIMGKERLNLLKHEISNELIQAISEERETLSPGWKPAPNFMETFGRHFPVWTAVVFCAGIAFSVYYTLLFWLSHDAKNLSAGLAGLINK